MNLDKLFNWFSGEKVTQPDVKFGRYSDSYKKEKQVEYWNKANDYFEEGQYLKSYHAFLKYLIDEEQHNVSIKVGEKAIEFEILQGSKRVKGHFTEEKVSAETNVVLAKKTGVAFMRKLLEMNYQLRYGKYALADGVVKLKFGSRSLDASPEKLYFALKEVATHADKQDDMLISEFSMLEAIDNSHIEDLSDEEKALKFRYTQKWIKEILERVEQLDDVKFSGGIAYLLMNLAYRIDFLIAPEGKLMDELERIHNLFFAQVDNSEVELNDKIEKAFDKIAKIEKEKIYQELYRVRATFGVSNPIPHNVVIELINNNIENVLWYKENRYEDIASAIIEYIASFAMFHYGMHRPTKRLFNLIVECSNPDFFNELGFAPQLYDAKTKKLNIGALKKKLKEIEERARQRYPKFQINVHRIKFDNLIEFGESVLKEIKLLNYDHR